MIKIHIRLLYLINANFNRNISNNFNINFSNVFTWIRDIRKELVGGVKTSDRRQIFGLLYLHNGFFGFNANGHKPGAHGLKPSGRFFWNFFLIF